jgi:hypothetical protein
MQVHEPGHDQLAACVDRARRARGGDLRLDCCDASPADTEVMPATQALARVDDLAAAHDQVEPLLGCRQSRGPGRRQRGRLLEEATARAGAHRRAV